MELFVHLRRHETLSASLHCPLFRPDCPMLSYFETGFPNHQFPRKGKKLNVFCYSSVKSQAVPQPTRTVKQFRGRLRSLPRDGNRGSPSLHSRMEWRELSPHAAEDREPLNRRLRLSARGCNPTRGPMVAPYFISGKVATVRDWAGRIVNRRSYRCSWDFNW